MLYILYLYFSACSIDFLKKRQLKILFILKKKSVTHIWVTVPPRKHTSHSHIGDAALNVLKYLFFIRDVTFPYFPTRFADVTFQDLVRR